MKEEIEIFKELNKIDESFWKFFKENEIILKEEVEDGLKVLEKFKEMFKK